MNDWKAKLRDNWRTLGQSGSPEKRGEKPANIDFVPPESWLQDAPTDTNMEATRTAASKGMDRPSGSTRPTPAQQHPGRLERPPANPEPVMRSLEFRPRIDASRSLTMPDWATTIGKVLQHPRRSGGRDLPVRLGVDFGTLFTKVAIRVGMDMVVVDWSTVTGDGSQVGRWVVPGFVCRGAEGDFGWRGLEGGEWQGNLKLPFIEAEGDPDCPTSTLAYLALIIRYARAFLYASQRQLVEGRSLRWELNLGCPTAPHENPEIVKRFRRMASTAWWLAGCNDLDEEAIRSAWEQGDIGTGLEIEPGIVPEFVAQIAGYLRSPQVNEGLHALVDVGAATLDVATFNVVLPGDRDGTPRIPIFFSAVKPLGTHFLSHRRHAELKLELVWDDAKPVEAATEFASRHGKDPALVERIDTGFVEGVAKCITHVIDSTRTNLRGNPNAAAWCEGLQIFVTGGGAACDLYRLALRTSESAVKAAIGSATRFRFIEMDLARSTSTDLDPTAAPRLTVAIGLTEDAEDIARIVPHRDIKPIDQPVRRRLHHEDFYGD